MYKHLIYNIIRIIQYFYKNIKDLIIILIRDEIYEIYRKVNIRNRK